MILHGIEVTKFKWNDKVVSEEEYLRLDEEWKQKCLTQQSSDTIDKPKRKKK